MAVKLTFTLAHGTDGQHKPLLARGQQVIPDASGTQKAPLCCPGGLLLFTGKRLTEMMFPGVGAGSTVPPLALYNRNTVTTSGQ